MGPVSIVPDYGLSEPSRSRPPLSLATNTDFKIEKSGSDHLMARDRNISAIVWLEDRDTIFLKWLAEDAAALCDARFSLAETRIVGDSLLNPAVGSSVLLPVPQEGQEIWYTPMFFTDTWQLRVAPEKIKFLEAPKKGEAS